jgi:hypothetical protein
LKAVFVQQIIHGQDKHAEAEGMHQQALQLKEKVLGAGHPLTLDSMNNLAILIKNQGKY